MSSGLLGRLSLATTRQRGGNRWSVPIYAGCENFAAIGSYWSQISAVQGRRFKHVSQINLFSVLYRKQLAGKRRSNRCFQESVKSDSAFPDGGED